MTMTTETETTESEVQSEPAAEQISERDQILNALSAYDNRGEDDLVEREPMPEKPASGESGKKQEGEDTDNAKREMSDKEAERFDRNWKKFQEEKDAFKKEREELERFREDTFKQIREKRFNSETSPEAYEQAANDFEEDGREDLARQARQKAKEARDEYEQEKAEFENHKRRLQWEKNYQEAVKAAPDLADETSEFHRIVKSVLKERPILTSYPDGIKDAVEIAKLATEANMLKAVQEEKSELEKRIKELEAKIQPGGSSVSPGSKSSGIETMKTEEAREYFRRRFAEFDN